MAVMTRRGGLAAIAGALCVGTTLVAGAPTPPAAAAHPSFRVEVTGQGRPMILIPGFMSSGDTWKSTVARYQDRFRCHVLTLAGFAGVPPIKEPLLATVRKELVAYIRAERMDRPVIVGHSLGGTLALTIAAENPAMTGPLVLVDSLPFLAGAQMQAKNLEEAKASIAAMHAYMSTQTRAQFEAYVKAGTATEFMVTRPGDHDVIRAWGLASDQRTAADAMAELMGIDARLDVAKITAPTLVLGTWVGLQEQLKKYGMPLERVDVIRTFDEQFTKLSKLHFAVTDTARHFIMYDDPAWFFAQLDPFLNNPESVVRVRGFQK